MASFACACAYNEMEEKGSEGGREEGREGGREGGRERERLKVKKCKTAQGEASR